MNNSEIAAKAALDFRDELLGMNWAGDTEIARLAGLPTGVDVGEYALQAREAGVLLGAWSAPRHAFVYPAFQFDQSGKPLPDVVELLALLPKDDDRSGWRRTFWLYSPHAHLDKRSPAEVFASDPARVLAVARDEFNGDSNAIW